MAETLQIGIDAKDGLKTLNILDENIKKLKGTLKELNIGSREYEATAKQLKNTLEEKSKALASAKTEMAKLKDSYFTLGEEIRRKTNPAMISLNQIVQDAPFGIRGMGNNIQYLTQQFTQLRAEGMSTGNILRGMWQNAVSPLGLAMIGVSAVTSGLTMYFNSLSSEAKEVKSEFEGILDKMRDIDEMRYERGAMTDAQYRAKLEEQLKIAETTRAKMESDAVSKQVTRGTGVYQLRGTRFVEKTVTETVPGKVFTTAEWTAADEAIEKAKTRLFNFDEDVKSQNDKAAKERIKKAKEEQKKEDDILRERSRQYENRQDFINEMLNENAEGRKKILDKELADESRIYERRQKFINQMINENAEKRKKEQEGELRSAINVYNSVFFDPLRAGFDSMISKSTSFADAFISALKRIIVQLLQFAAMSWILSLLFPGAGGFGAIFGKVSGLGGVLPTETTSVDKIRSTSGRSAPGGATLSNRTISNMNSRGGSPKMQVEVVGKIGNDAIYLAGNKYVALKNASRI